MTRLFFEDFTPGRVFTYGSKTFDKDEIISFAREFDAQLMHVDEAAAEKTFFGTLIASGWHLCAALMRMMCDEFVLNSSSMGAPGIDETRWQKPVKPGDTVSVRQTVLETRTSKTRPELGLVRTHTALINQHGEAVVEQTYWGMFGRRHPGPAEEAAPPRETARPAAGKPTAQAPVPGSGEPDDGPGRRGPYFDDIAIGRTTHLGSYPFTAEDIKRFARAYDPQPFHVDEEAARQSHFGALCASGWHTGSVWMKLMIEHRKELEAAAAADGEPMARLGPSPGFKNLRWLKPVYAGDSITYSSRVVDKRPSASRPGWGLVFSHNTGVNQKGEPVFAFDGCGFTERRG